MIKQYYKSIEFIFKIYGIHVVVNYFPNQQIHENFLTVTICT
jgi:hypothetical protein